MEIKECAEERQALLSSAENPETQENDERQHNGDEAISLRNLPLIHHQYEENEERSTTPHEAQDDFNFWSPLEESSSQMRAADEIFFQGQILPLRQYSMKNSDQNRNSLILQHNSISRSQSMDHYFSGESMLSSRSSSMNSHHSSTSSGGAPRNQFHSHPSPSPRILRNRQQIIRNDCVKKSLSWNVFRGGLIAAPPEIALGDLKSRCSGKNKIMSSEKKKKKRVKAWDNIVGGCKCSADAVDATVVSPEIAIIKRSTSREEDNSVPMKKSVNHRTSEWLKKLSVQGTAPAER